MNQLQKPVLFDHEGRLINTDRRADSEDRSDGMDVPHVLTFASLYRGAAYTYNHLWDEAMKHNPKNALAMRRDAWLMALLRERKDETLAKSWSIKVDNPKDPWQKSVADGITKTIQTIPRLKRLKRYLMEALWYGRYGASVKWAWQEKYLPVMARSGPAGPGVASAPVLQKFRVLTVVKHKPVNGDKINFHQDDTPYVLINSAFAEKLEGNPQIIYPSNAQGAGLLLRGTWRERMLIHESDPDDADYFEAELAAGIHGVGIRSRIYWLDYMRREYIGWVTESLERLGLGVVVIYYDSGNAAAKSEAMETAKKMSRRSAIVCPSSPDSTWNGGRIQVLEAPTAGALVVQQLKEAVELQIERFIVGQSMSGGADHEDGLGGTGRKEFAQETKGQLCRGDADDLAETLTGSDLEPGLVSTIKKWTYPWADFPVWFEYSHEEDDPQKTLEAIKTCVDMGVSFAEDGVRELTGMPAPKAGENTIGGKEALQAEQDAKMAGLDKLNGGKPGEGGGDPEKPAKKTEKKKYQNKEDELWSGGGESGVVQENYQFDPNEPRDESGKWTAGGAGGVSLKDKPQDKSPRQKKKPLGSIEQGEEELDTWVRQQGGTIAKVTSDQLDTGDLPEGVDALYEQTQAKLERRGIVNRDLYRGVAMKGEWLASLIEKGEADFSKASSWTDDSSVPDIFIRNNMSYGKHEVVFYAPDVPVDRIITSHDTSNTFAKVQEDEGLDDESENLAAIGKMKLIKILVGKRDPYEVDEEDLQDFINDIKNGTNEGFHDPSERIQLVFGLPDKEEEGGGLPSENYAFDPNEPRDDSGQWTAAKSKKNRFAGHSDKKLAAVVNHKHPINSNSLHWQKLSDEERQTLVESMRRWPKKHRDFQAEKSASHLAELDKYIELLRTNGYKDKPLSRLLPDALLTRESAEALQKMLREAGQDRPQENYSEDLAAQVDAAAAETDTSPSDEQKKAGNYRKGTVNVQGLTIAIENARGSIRSGKSKDGKEWSVTMAHHYGYIKRTESEADGDQVDVFIGPEPESEIVFVVDQMKDSGKFDEHKCMLGFTNRAAAEAGYLACYSPGWKGLGGIAPLTMDQFKTWIKEGDTSKPLAFGTN